MQNDKFFFKLQGVFETANIFSFKIQIRVVNIAQNWDKKKTMWENFGTKIL